MIVVVGQLLFRTSAAGPIVDGLPARIALAAAAGGRPVQLVGKAGEDAAGDAVVMALAQGGVGHAALLRDAGRPTPRALSAAADALAGDVEPIGKDIEPRDADIPVGTAGRPDPQASVVLDAADVDLALRYLTDFSVVVVADPVSADVQQVVTAAAAWTGARMIVVMPAGEAAPAGLAVDAIVFEAPGTDDGGAFASMVGAFAAALDDGEDPAAAFQSTVEGAGWTAAPAE